MISESDSQYLDWGHSSDVRQRRWIAGLRPASSVLKSDRDIQLSHFALQSIMAEGVEGLTEVQANDYNERISG